VFEENYPILDEFNGLTPHAH